MKIEIYSQNNNYNRYKSNNLKNDVSFGFNAQRLFMSSKAKKFEEKAERKILTQISLLLRMDKTEVSSKIKGFNETRKILVRSLSKRYSDENFYLKGNLKDDPNIVFDVIQNLKKPKDFHWAAIHNINDSFGYISRLLPLLESNNDVEFIYGLAKKLPSHNNKSINNIALEILQSPYKRKYLSHFDDYKSYLTLNRDNPEAVKELDMLVENNHYDRNVYDVKLSVKRILGSSNFKSNKYINKDNVEKYYSKSGAEFLDRFINEYYDRQKTIMSADSEIALFNIYKSSTKNNISPRLGIIEKFKNAVVYENQDIDKEISAMQKLFELIDNDKNAKNFVNKFVKNDSIELNSIQILNEVLTELTPKKANMFSDNIFRIFRRVDDKNLIQTLKKNYNNPFFETESSKYANNQMIKYGFKAPESRVSKFMKLIKNKINEMLYAYSERKTASQTTKSVIEPVIEKPAQKPIVEEIKPNIISNEKVEEKVIKQPKAADKQKTVKQVEQQEVKPEVKIKPYEWNSQKALPPQPQRLAFPKPEEDIKLSPVNELPSPDKANDLPIRLERIISTAKEETPIKIVNTPKESPKARKLRLIGEVNELIAKRLGAKTIEKQGEDYSKNVTKMRLKMLPEIFDSIKETRKVDRAVGKSKLGSSNSDAVKLYNLIKGSNRKYVKYLLEKRNVDGTRMFEVKEIISMIEKANKKVDIMKKSKPDFKAKDEKAYFDHLYDAKVEQYGKVKKSRKLYLDINIEKK